MTLTHRDDRWIAAIRKWTPASDELIAKIVEEIEAADD